ncbi:fimbrial protein [Enterobacteriaceae bacterium H20N1]|uniref:Fimbrial protein n=1 Tax=Dryocola boscaweniae TaxID=2925397 RepID=A0A9X2W762_9ENTR|nr:fimbrial protein [Dryocola boscaweniae]MCT4702251.1 fimbrial protein [Dryocola boscaweniae]MCT4719305.1 fimbrial protein [Dryocola boscaweniae]
MKSQFRIMALMLSTLASGAAISGASGVNVNPGSDAGTQSTGGQVQFTGSITDTSCNIDTESANQTVDLGKWSSSYFGAAGTETTKTPFHIKVQDCPDSVTSVAVLFDGNHDATDKNMLAIDSGANAATGVAIELYEASRNQKINLGSVTEEYPINAGSTGNDGTADLTFYADYRSTADDVTVGDANGVANFNMVYN